MSRTLIVGISDYIVARKPDILVTYALGSCVGVCLYDDKLQIGGLSHIMLPDSTQFAKSDGNRMKYADTAIADLVKEMQALGSDMRSLTAQIAGGAKMFQTQQGSQVGSIGDRNVDSVKQILTVLRIPIVFEDTRKNYGRSVFFDLSIGTMEIRSLNKSMAGL